MKIKKCNTCFICKPLNQFQRSRKTYKKAKNSHKKWYHYPICKDCNRETKALQDKKTREKRKAEKLAKQPPKPFVKDGFCICKKCGIEKPLTIEFFLSNYDKRTNKAYWSGSCRTCHNATSLDKNRAYKKKNRKKLAKAQRKYHAEHKEQDAATKRKWYDENKEHVKEKAKLDTKKKRKDPVFRLRQSVSSNIRSVLKNGKGGESILKYLPYTIAQLKDHLEKLFKPWMTWDNYGKYSVKTWDDKDKTTWKWNLDHKIPHCRFKYETMDCQEFRDCWALTNLRPYSAKQNTLDGNRR